MRKLVSFLKLPRLVRLSVAARPVLPIKSGSNATDNAYYLTATYKIAQNMLARLSYVKQNGTTGICHLRSQVLTNAQNTGSNVTAINLYTLF